MSFSNRFSNGWEITKISFRVLRANKSLIIFPVLSGIALGLIVGSFFAVFLSGGANAEHFQTQSRAVQYFVVFLLYVVNYFIVVFFNMALMHCADLYVDGKEVSVGKGLSFSFSRIGTILLWAVFAATVGTILKMIQDNVGWLGKALIGIVGFVWSAATYLVVPVIAYENVTPFEALKRSANMMRERWGDSVGANFSMGLVALVCIMIVAIAGTAVSSLINEQAGILIFVFGALATLTISSALHSIFVSMLYNQINGKPGDHLNDEFINDLFIER